MWRLFGGFMEKKFADQMIEQFQTKFFDFALSKCQNMQEAEALEARINQLVEKCVEIEKSISQNTCKKCGKFIEDSLI